MRPVVMSHHLVCTCTFCIYKLHFLSFFFFFCLRRVHTLIGHMGEISNVQFNWDCSLIASGSTDKTCKVGIGVTFDSLTVLALFKSGIKKLYMLTFTENLVLLSLGPVDI